jgi:hypothetical protein
MLFDITQYDQVLAIGLFILFSIALLKLFSPCVTSLFDPLLSHVIWLGSTATLVCLLLINNVGDVEITVIFLFGVTIYIIASSFFMRKYALGDSGLKSEEEEKSSSSSSYFYSLRYLSDTNYIIIVLVLSLASLYSLSGFFQYLQGVSSYQEVFLYRFVDLQGRDPLLRIIGTGIGPYLNFFLIGGLFRRGIVRRTAITLITINLALGIFSGGRSSFFGIIFIFGQYVFFYRNYIPKSLLKGLNTTGLALIFLGFIIAAFVSSTYQEGTTFSDGLGIIYNRVFAAADGIEYYVKYGGSNKLNTGIDSFFVSVFGIYMKRFLDMPEVKNVGWQLTELALGTEVPFAQGANYSFLLQGVILSPYLVPLYSIIIAFAAAKLRYSSSKKALYQPVQFFLSTSAISMVSDMELYIFTLLCGLSCFYLFVLPVLLIINTLAKILKPNKIMTL